MNIEVHSDTEISIVITNVHAFREGFERHGIQGGRFGATDKSTKGEYVRLMPKLNVTTSEDKVYTMIEDVLHNAQVRVLIDGEYQDDSPVGLFFAKLRERPHLNF